MPEADTVDGGLLQQFIYDEAALLDEDRLEEWLDLFTDDAIYWVPIDVDSPSPRIGLNLIYDDRRRLNDRIQRFRSGLSHSEDPPSRSMRLIGNVRLGGEAARLAVSGAAELADNDLVVGAQCLVTRVRPTAVETYHARLTFVIRVTDRLRLRMKRIDLVHATHPMPTLTFLL